MNLSSFMDFCNLLRNRRNFHSQFPGLKDLRVAGIGQYPLDEAVLLDFREEHYYRAVLVLGYGLAFLALLLSQVWGDLGTAPDLDVLDNVVVKEVPGCN